LSIMLSIGSGLGPLRHQRPLAFVQPCPMGVTPLPLPLATPMKNHACVKQ